MDINSSHAARHSEQDFSRKFSTYVDSGVGVIHVRTHEIIRAAMALRKQIIVDGGSVKEWDIVNGFKTYTRDNVNDVLVTGDSNIDIGGAFAVPLDNLKNNAGAQNIMCYVYLNPHVFMEGNPTLAHLLMTYSHVLPATNTVVVVLTPDMPLPVDSGANILSMHFDPPGLGELKDSLTGILSGVMEDFSEGEALTEQEIEKVCYVGAGMTKNHFEMYSALAIVEAGREGKTALTVDDLIGGVSIGKTDVVNSNDILELYPSTDIKNVGGLENLKSWVAKRRDCYSDDAKEFGIEAPKGMVLVGLPGTGKSLVAKAIASELGVPLVRLDFGRVFNSLVGASESRMRTALKMVETMSPCVLFCVDGKTEVTLADGAKERIEDMYMAVQNGIRYTLRGLSPDTGDIIDLPMSDIIRTQGKPMVRITSESGKQIEVTHDHRLLVNVNGERVWIPAEELRVGDDLVEVS